MQFKTNLFAILISGVPASLACGKYEFYGFDDLPESAQKAAEAIGYVKKVWNAYGANKLEKLSYDDLALDPDTLKAIVTLDLVGDNGNCWDHYINHYQGYVHLLHIFQKSDVYLSDDNTSTVYFTVTVGTILQRQQIVSMTICKTPQLHLDGIKICGTRRLTKSQ